MHFKVTLPRNVYMKPADLGPAQRQREVWQAFCQALMVSNEFVYLD